MAWSHDNKKNPKRPRGRGNEMVWKITYLEDAQKFG